MDIIDILGGLLNQKAGGGSSKGSGKGPDILKDILTGGKRAEPEKRPSSGQSPPTADDLKKSAKELEDLLHVARNRDPARGGGQPQQQPSPRQMPQRTSVEPSLPVDSPYAPRSSGRPSFPQAGRPTQDEQALVLVRAMVNAAKADGEITADEQQNILKQFGNQPDAIQFLRDELRRPLDVREFAWSVPIGLEHQVYAMSLMAIDADSQAESQYLDELAHGLRLSAEAREQLNRQYASR